MNDRYLFKAKGQTDGKWRTGLLANLQENRCIIHESDRFEWICNSETLCQCTDLKDKNGTLIWENDICDRREKVPEIVNYNEGDWQLDYSYAYGKEKGYACCNLGFYVKERKCVEVIGNIFDNPELLEMEERRC